MNEVLLPTHEHGARIRADAIERDSMLSEISTDYCPFCEDLFDDIQNIVVRILRETEGVEFNSLQMGYHISKELVEEEDYLRKRFGARGAPPLKASFAAAVELALKEKMTDVTLVKEVPDVMILVDSLTLRVKAEDAPCFPMEGIVRCLAMLLRARWLSRSCKGHKGGCDLIEMTGLQCPAFSPGSHRRTNSPVIGAEDTVSMAWAARISMSDV